MNIFKQIYVRVFLTVDLSRKRIKGEGVEPES